MTYIHIGLYIQSYKKHLKSNSVFRPCGAREPSLYCVPLQPLFVAEFYPGGPADEVSLFFNANVT